MLLVECNVEADKIRIEDEKRGDRFLDITYLDIYRLDNKFFTPGIKTSSGEIRIRDDFINTKKIIEFTQFHKGFGC